MSPLTIALCAWLGLVAAVCAPVHAAPLGPMRPLPAPAPRARPVVAAHWVDPARGTDEGPGTRQQPWRTLAHAFAHLAPGDTLYLRGGVHRGAPPLTVHGTVRAPITVRSAPGELAIIDGGEPLFLDDPDRAWEPVGPPAGGEFRSTIALDDVPAASADGRGAWVTGNFADSMVPLHPYRYATDLRATNERWNLADKLSSAETIYVGPGVWLDPATRRVHIRLAPTTVAPDNYTGDTDPRTLRLVIAVRPSALVIDRAEHLRLRDLVLRGAAAATLSITSTRDLELDNVTVYGGSPALNAHDTHHLRVRRSRIRGLAAPWSSRASMKYRGNSPYLVRADSRAPRSTDWEIADSELTDGHDGIVLDSLRKVRFHHNLVDNFNDDALYLSLPPRVSPPEDVQIFANVFRHALTTIAFAEADDHQPAPTGPGVYVFRNVFDLREGTYSWPPTPPADRAALAASKLCGDHGSPVWEPLLFYQNTVVSAEPAFRGVFGAGILTNSRGSSRHVLNNIFVQLSGALDASVPSDPGTLDVRGNVRWTFDPSTRRTPPAAGTDAMGRIGDPGLPMPGTLTSTLDVTLGSRGAAIGAGVTIPPAWPDLVRRRRVDAGALPAGTSTLKIGPRSRP